MSNIRRARASRTRREGRHSEWLAALWLLVHGWRIVGLRVRTTQGEIDLLARRGRILAVIEVKRRRSLDEALAAVGPVQRRRLARATSAVCTQRSGWSNLHVRLDLIALAPRQWPIHLPDA